jgi:hypothetical protein
MFKMARTTIACSTSIVLLALSGCAGEPQTEDDITVTRSAVVGTDTFLYLTCNGTGWQPNATTRLRSTSDPTVFTVDIDIRQSSMVTGSDDCQLLETNQLDGWGTTQTRYTTRDTTLLKVPASSRLQVSTVHFGVKYPALGRYNARINWQQGTISVQAAPVPHDLRVLFVGYNPSNAQTTLADRYFSGLYNGLTADQAEDATAAAQIAAFSRLSNGRVRYQVVKKINDRTFDPYTDGTSYTMDSYAACLSSPPPAACENKKFLFDYPRWIAENHVCELADQNAVDEIWVQSAPFIQTWENFMIGPTAGFDVNGPAFVIPACKKHYVVHNPTYQAAPSPFLHIFGHRVEATMGFLTGKWTSADRNQHWERFAATSRYSFPANQILADLPNPYCGNAHFPSNAQSHYDYGNPRQKSSICGDWANFPAYSNSVLSVTCSSWGCSDNGWGEYWLGSIPTGIGTFGMTSASGKAFAFPLDWWNLLLSADQALAFNAPL